MSIIQLKEANCKNCYKCIRNCALKAIQFRDEQARVMDEDCVLCGKCILVCPQNAKQIFSDLDDVKKLLAGGAKVFVSLAPSYISAFPGVSFAQMSGALKQLGFTGVEETAIGATEVTREYTRIIQKKELKNIITTCCPTVTLLVEKYYPQLIPYLASVAAPATVHARMIKNIYGNRSKVVFIGPCISKKHEAQHTGAIHSVLLFDELKVWMQQEGIAFETADSEPTEMHTIGSRLYPMPGGIIKTIPHQQRQGYKTIAVDGLERCKSILQSLCDNEIEGYLIEMSACAGSCMEGPGIQKGRAPFLTAKTQLLSNAAQKTLTPMPLTENTHPDLSVMHNRSRVRSKMPDEETIAEIFWEMGKYDEQSMLNCGACGYSTCRDKAIAVFQGKADLHMCLPHLREKAESMSNLIIDNTPNGIFVANKHLEVIEYNRAAQKIFNIGPTEGVGLPVRYFIDAPEFDQIKDAREQTIIYTTLTDKEREITLDLIILSARNSRDYIVIARDITSDERNREQIEQMRQETINIAQKVIDKQMRVAQEIASLLGETTGETKAALSKLKTTMMAGEL